MLTTGTPIILEDLFEACEKFFSMNGLKYSIHINEIEFNKIIKEIENTFITLKKDSNHILAADYLNPSISDFLLNYISSRKYLISDLIISAKYANQFFNIFTIKSEQVKSKYSKKILLTDSDRKFLIKQLSENLETIDCSSIYMMNYVSGRNSWHKHRSKLFQKLDYITDNIDLDENSIISQIAKIIEIQLKEKNNSYFIEIVSIYKKISSFIKTDVIDAIDALAESMECVMHLTTFSNLKKEFPNEYTYIINTPKFVTKLEEIINSECDNVSDDYIENLISELEVVADDYGVDVSLKINSLNDRIEEIRESIVENNASLDAFSKLKDETLNINIDDEIKELFLSLQLN